MIELYKTMPAAVCHICLRLHVWVSLFCYIIFLDFKTYNALVNTLLSLLAKILRYACKQNDNLVTSINSFAYQTGICRCFPD